MLGAPPVFLNGRQVTVRVDVTGAGTVPEFARRIVAVRILILLVWPGLVIARVAASAIKLKRRIPPGDGFRIGLVTVRAIQVVAVIERFVRQCRMTKLVR